ncbi:hypothetical protein [Burkholderia orbicola]|uniref:hypothetical protein n=1 Tax=Burkholderia orbicola TaxID=2978683 RepID=UPI002FE3EE4A
MTNLADGTRDKAHANRTETGQRRGSVGHVADDLARHRTVADRLTSADRRMDEHKPRGRTAGACPRTSQAGAPDQTAALPPGRGRATAPVQLPQGGALAIASAICSGVRSR